MDRRMSVRALLVLFTITASAQVAVAGPLTPPPGVPSGTMKPLSEVEPRIAINATNTPGDAVTQFKITQPGSYYFTGNVTGVTGKYGIVIASSNVTIDFMGFSYSGVAGAQGGISVDNTYNNLTVRNGSVSNWGGTGVYIGGGLGSLVERVHATSNADGGIVANNNAVVRDCTAQSNTGPGIVVSTSGVVVNCSSRANTGYGIATGNAGTVTGCTIRENGGAGVAVLVASKIDNCSLYSNLGGGIAASNGSLVTDCTVMSSTGTGISVSSGSLVARCMVQFSTAHGISMGADCMARDNMCDSNGNGSDGAGILVTSSDSRVEGNNCTDNDWGIRVTSAGNIIVRNTCSGNTTLNWDVVANNVCYVVNGVLSGSIIGNSGGFSPGTSDPNANFTY